MTGSDDGRDLLRTRWSMLREMQGPQREAAWRWFVERYRPVVAAMLARRLGPDTSAVDDFWSYVLERDIVAKADATRRFRPFLSGVLRRYTHEWRRAHGPVATLAPDSDHPGLRHEDGEGDARLWAQRVVNLALGAVEPQHAALLRAFYGVSEDGALVATRTVSELVADRGGTPGALHQALRRARQSLRRRVESEVRELVADRAALQEELDDVFAAIARTRPGIAG